jgi:hypothetical protein
LALSDLPLGRANCRRALADAGVALTRSGGPSQFQRARLRDEGRRSRTGTIGHKRPVAGPR